MHSADYSDFEATIKQLEKVFGKSLDDETISAYWHSLRDLNIATLKRCAERHQKFGKFFPKPSELRPKDEKAPVEGNPQDFQRLLDQNRRMWTEFHQQDSVLAEIEQGIAQWGRILVTDHPSTPQYAEALRMDRTLRDRRHALHQSRAAG